MIFRLGRGVWRLCDQESWAGEYGRTPQLALVDGMWSKSGPSRLWMVSGTPLDQVHTRSHGDPDSFHTGGWELEDLEEEKGYKVSSLWRLWEISKFSRANACWLLESGLKLWPRIEGRSWAEQTGKEDTHKMHPWSSFQGREDFQAEFLAHYLPTRQRDAGMKFGQPPMGDCEDHGCVRQNKLSKT